MVILPYLIYGETGISVFPFCSCSLSFGVHMHNKHVLYTLEDCNDEIIYNYYTVAFLYSFYKRNEKH